MLIEAYVKVTLLLSGLPHTLERRIEAKKREDGGLATLEWVALIIVALALTVTAAGVIKTALDNKLKDIK
ncbi:MAG TPA: hypothetical protein VE781_01555 [Kineosporiaceae bacterium]|nr:hypothetical protein [Kineosporiaceae bacterium]